MSAGIGATAVPLIFRAPLRSAAPGADRAFHARQVRRCLEGNVIGLGWQVTPAPTDLAEALRLIRARGWASGAHTVKRFADAPSGSLIWTRTTDGRFALGELQGAWRYDNSPAARETDTVHVRPVRWAPRSLLDVEVPGGVIRAFAGRGSSFSRIHDHPTRLYSALLWRQLTGQPTEIAGFDISPEIVLKTLLAPFDVEDLVFVLLQVQQGLIVLPASRRTDTSSYEYALVDRNTGNLAVAQVKTGATHVDLAALAASAGGGTGYAYAACGRYDNGPLRSVTVITDEELLRFARTHPTFLPPRVARWFELTTSTDTA